MATVSDLTTTPVSGLNHIDALLDAGPDWNYLTAGGNTIYYTFSIASGNEKDQTGQEGFTIAQQAATRTAFSYLQEITGIQFVETAIGTNAQIHLCGIDLEGSGTTGLCSWSSPYSYNPSNNTIIDYQVNAYVYLDNVEWRAQNADLTVGGNGYQTLLHELGHALGLKHPFEDPIQLPDSQDNTTNTLMSYDDVGGPYSTFSPYDLAALKWLYGGDGLRGALGVNSTSEARYLMGTKNADVLTGTSANDVLEGAGGSDRINGGAGEDTVVFGRSRASYTFSQSGSGDLLAFNSVDGTITLSNVETLRFTDGSYQRAQVIGDVDAPARPTLAVSKNVNGYAMGNKPLISGEAEANATVRVYHGERLAAETKADASGIWSVVAGVFEDGLNYSVFATATDAAGNTSAASGAVSFHVDATAPVIPTSGVTLAAGSNSAVFEGRAEAGTTIQLVRLSDAVELGRTVVKTDGSWKIENLLLPDGAYDVRAVSVDAADNATSAASRQQFNVDSDLNLTGSSARDSFSPGAGNNAIDGQGGLDTAVYAGNRADFTLTRGVYGFDVAAKSGTLGTDKLVNVERIQFNDTMVGLDVDGAAGQTYRMYRAAFDREPDKAGMAFWIKALDTGAYSVNDIAAEFIKNKEFVDMYMSDPSDQNFVTKLYAHVLHRPAEGAGFDYWVNGLKQVSRAEVLAFFSESPENQAQVIGTIQNGIEFPGG